MGLPSRSPSSCGRPGAGVPQSTVEVSVPVTGGRKPRGLIAAAVVAALVTVGALAAAAVLRWRTEAAGNAGQRPSAESTVEVGCQSNDCTVLVRTSVSQTTVDLVTDQGRSSSWLRFTGGPAGDVVIETTTGELGMRLTDDPLQCYAGEVNACLVRGSDRRGLAGVVAVDRSGTWSLLESHYLSDGGYLALADVEVGAAPEVIAVQHDCEGFTDCSGSPVFAQVFTLDGVEIGCTGNLYDIEDLPGYPEIQLTEDGLRTCG